MRPGNPNPSPEDDPLKCQYQSIKNTYFVFSSNTNILYKHYLQKKNSSIKVINVKNVKKKKRRKKTPTISNLLGLKFQMFKYFIESPIKDRTARKSNINLMRQDMMVGGERI